MGYNGPAPKGPAPVAPPPPPKAKHDPNDRRPRIIVERPAPPTSNFPWWLIFWL